MDNSNPDLRIWTNKCSDNRLMDSIEKKDITAVISIKQLTPQIQKKIRPNSVDRGNQSITRMLVYDTNDQGNHNESNQKIRRQSYPLTAKYYLQVDSSSQRNPKG